MNGRRPSAPDAVVVACPLCHMNLDLRQRQAVGGSMKMPVLYFTQLMGLALGLPHQELGFEKLCVSPDELLRKIDARAGCQGRRGQGR